MTSNQALGIVQLLSKLGGLAGIPGAGVFGSLLGLGKGLGAGNLTALAGLPSLAGGTGLLAGTGGLGAGMAGLAPALSMAGWAALPAMVLAWALPGGFGDMAKRAEQIKNQIKEFRQAGKDFPTGLRQRLAGAEVLGQPFSPENFIKAYEGIGAGTTLSRAFNPLKYGEGVAHIKPVDMSKYEKVAGVLEGKNWLALLQQLDKAGPTGLAGLDPGWNYPTSLSPALLGRAVGSLGHLYGVPESKLPGYERWNPHGGVGPTGADADLALLVASGQAPPGLRGTTLPSDLLSQLAPGNYERLLQQYLMSLGGTPPPWEPAMQYSGPPPSWAGVASASPPWEPPAWETAGPGWSAP